MADQPQLLHYWKLAQLVKSNQAKIAFFNDNEEAFNLDPWQGEDFENCKHSFCAEKEFDTEAIEDFQDNSWLSFPEEFKVYAFQYCIEDVLAYESIQESISVEEITSLISIEKLNEQLEDEGLMISEAEDDVMLILEKKLKKAGKNVCEDDLYDATKKLLNELRDYLDDNHPDNLKVAWLDLQVYIYSLCFLGLH